MRRNPKKTTSWESSSEWYDKIVGVSGHYYHREIVIPGVMRLLDLKRAEEPRVIDFACGQGILGRQIAAEIPYCGIDLSKKLIAQAKQYDKCPEHTYLYGDITQELPKVNAPFTHAAMILALQNLDNPGGAIKNVAKVLEKGGKFVCVINHPCFRIPRQSSWGVEEAKKLQYRRIESYMSAQQIPIQTHPSQGKESAQSWTYHFPLSSLMQWLNGAGFLVESIEEWCSNKQSEGKSARMENRARKEFPLFMAIKAIPK